MYEITVCGLTFELPQQHTFRTVKGVWVWRFRAVYESRHLDEWFQSQERATVGGATVRVWVTDDELRAICIADLLRRRDSENRTLRQTEEKLRIINKRLFELGHADG